MAWTVDQVTGMMRSAQHTVIEPPAEGTCLRHQWSPEIALDRQCLVCGVPYPFQPEEIYRLEKMKRGSQLQAYKADGTRDTRYERATRDLQCPKCQSLTIIWTGRVRKYENKKSRKVRCVDCQYVWRTVAKEALGGSRRVEVRE